MFNRSMVLIFMLAASPALASSLLSGDKLFETLAGKSFMWPDKTVSTYTADGKYRWNGTTSLEGTWRVRGDKVCVTFASGSKRCDKYLYRGQQLQLENAKGKRFSAVEVR